MRRPVVLVLLSLALAGCGSNDEPAPAPRAAATPSASPSTSPSPSPFAVLDGPLRRCGPQPAALGKADLRPAAVRDPAVGRIPVVTSGSGRTVAVLLHQTDGSGLCGWLEYVPALTAGGGVATLAIDICPYGVARCADDVEPTDVVAAAVRYARQTLRADRVVVVGASMGGSIALMAAAAVDGIDAVVDLSGPTDWPGMARVRGGRAIRVPALVAMDRVEEGPEQFGSARRIVARAPAGSRFVAAEDGHGYDLVEPLLAEITGWVAGTDPPQ